MDIPHLLQPAKIPLLIVLDPPGLPTHAVFPIQIAAHRSRVRRQNKIATPLWPAKTEATAAADEPKSATKRSESRAAPLFNPCTKAMSMFRTVRADFLRIVLANFLSSACLLLARRFLLVCRLPTLTLPLPNLAEILECLEDFCLLLLAPDLL